MELIVNPFVYFLFVSRNKKSLPAAQARDGDVSAWTRPPASATRYSYTDVCYIVTNKIEVNVCDDDDDEGEYETKCCPKNIIEKLMRPVSPWQPYHNYYSILFTFREKLTRE